MFFASWEDDVVAAHLESSKLPMQTDDDGRIINPKAASLLDHAQRIARGACSTCTPTRGATTN